MKSGLRHRFQNIEVKNIEEEGNFRRVPMFRFYLAEIICFDEQSLYYELYRKRSFYSLENFIQYLQHFSPRITNKTKRVWNERGRRGKSRREQGSPVNCAKWNIFVETAMLHLTVEKKKVRTKTRLEYINPSQTSRFGRERGKRRKRFGGFEINCTRDEARWGPMNKYWREVITKAL